MSTYEDRCLHKMSDGKKCFMRKKEGKCYSLTISGTNLEAITDKRVWGMCKELEIVILYMNKLSTLPIEELLQFKETITLICIQNNCFREIPENFYDFTKLEHLNIHGNFLEVVPEDFKNFTLLTRLYLGDNDLISLPNVIFGNFRKLKKASFKINSLTRLPVSFSSLHMLVNLDISDNKIIKFPKPLLVLKNLKVLNVERNKIQKLTDHKDELYQPTFDFFKQLSHLQIKGNPIEQHELLQGTTKDQHHRNELILKRLQDDIIFDQLSQIERSKSLRVNVLGESGAGKTSVVEALTLGKHVIPTTQKDHRHTVGIDRCYFPVKIGEKTILLHIWDHAGDNEYAMMNDLFISNRSLVWLVVNLDKYCLKENKYDQDRGVFHEAIGHWLYQVMSHNLKPIVWIICTHMDKSNACGKLKKKHMKYWALDLCNSFKHSLSERKKEYIEELKKCGPNEDLEKKRDHIQSLLDENVPQFLWKHMKIIKLTNTYSFEGLSKLQKKLKSFDCDSKSDSPFSYLTTPLPIEWEKAMDGLQRYAEEEVNHLTISNAIPTITKEEIKKKLQGMQLEIDLDQFLNYLHDIGEIYLLPPPEKDTEGKSLIVLNIQWMINLLKEVYRHDFKENLDKLSSQPCFKHIKDLKQKKSDSVKMRNENGLILDSILKPLWLHSGNLKEEIFDRIIKLFTDFNLTVSLKIHDEDCHFFPQLVQSNFSKENYDIGGRRHITLQYIFKFFFPQFFEQRLALKLLHITVPDTTKIYNDGFTTELKGTKGRIRLHITRLCYDSESPYSNVMELFVSSPNNNPSKSQDLWSVLSNVLQTIHDLLSSYWKFHGDTEFYVLCPNCVHKREEKPNFLRLMQFNELQCCEEYKSIELCCQKCNQSTLIDNLLPPPPDDQNSNRLNDASGIKGTESDEFIKILSRWKVKPMGAPLALSNSEMSSYVASQDPWVDPIQEQVLRDHIM